MKKFGFKKGAEEFPLMVVLSVTYVCNSKCPQCPYTNSEIRKTYKDALFMSSDIFKRIADECGKYGAYIRLSGGGEPLFHKDIVELIEYAKKAGAKIGLITNGSLMTEEIADRLLSCNTDIIEFSVDAADKKTYAEVRTGLNFDVLVKNVKYVVKRRNELKSPTRIIVSVIEQKAVKGKLDSIIEFWKKIVDKVQTRKYLTWGINKPEEATDQPIQSLLPENRPPCRWLFERLNIDSRGDFTICGEDIAFKEKFANIKDASIKEVWLGEEFNYYRKMHLERRGGKIPLCRNCPDWRYRSWRHTYWGIIKEAEEKRKKTLTKETKA